jgi:hypothetical protein
MQNLTRAILTLAALAAMIALPGCLGCGTGCPTSPVPAERARWEAELAAKEPLALRPSGAIAIKRDVHVIFAGVEAAAFADAFQRVMMDPSRRYGLIRVDRLAANAGKPFAVGEKFQGRYSIEGAIARDLGARWKRIFGDLVDHDEVQDVLCGIENDRTSDYGVISRLELSPAPGHPYVLEYRYLEGSPIAGSSTFLVTEAAPADLARLGVPKAARLEQVFTYQEQSSSFAVFFGHGGLKLHDQVVMSQARQAAELAGGRVIESDIPPEYEKL